MTGPWRHPPGTLRALRATFGDQYVICRACRRAAPMRIPNGQADRKYEPCPYRCGVCRQRGEIVFAVPDGFTDGERRSRP